MEWSRTIDRSGGLRPAEDGCSNDYAYLRKLVLGRSHNVLDPSRDFVFQGKLTRLIRDMGFTELHDLVEHLRHTQNDELEAAIADAMTVNETSFFRDTRPFELLRTKLLPELIEARQRTKTLRIWSAGCSTGQEPYSLAMLIRENFHLLGAWKIHIEGTDISKEVVERAKAGVYERIEVNRGLPRAYLAKYFERTGERWRVNPEIHAMCGFRRMNLGNVPLAFTQRFDVILLRNVMLYFGPGMRKSVMTQVHRLLAPDGVLMMGATEQPQETKMWRAEIVKGACFFRPTQKS